MIYYDRNNNYFSMWIMLDNYKSHVRQKNVSINAKGKHSIIVADEN
jgi:hypothetical protein